MPDTELQEIRRYLERIDAAIIGDPERGVRGIACRVENVESTVNNIQRERDTEKAERKGALRVAALISTCAGTLGAFIVEHFARRG